MTGHIERTAGSRPGDRSARSPDVGERTASPLLELLEHRLGHDVPLDPRLVLLHAPESERAAAFRVLRHHLLARAQPQVVIVSSPRPGDGKTGVAVNLALALAECGRAKVLLAEAHARRPELATVFRCAPPWCFAAQLAAHRQRPTLPWSLLDLRDHGLHLAAIDPRRAQGPLLDAAAVAIAIDRLRQAGYHHIVIDAPPVLGSAEVNLMADAADVVLCVARARVTTTRDLRRALDQLGADKVCGSVLVS